MSSAVSVTFVVMAGGKGERLWPLVRANRPKVCLSVDGQRSLIEATLQRLRLVWPAAQCLVVTTQGQADLVRAALPAALRQSVIVEPQAKNTAACITLAAVALGARSPQRIMVVVPADHWVGSTSQFQKTLRCAIRAAVAYDTIVTIGIPPKAPHPGLGYLCTGARLEGFRSSAVFQMERFIEKPSRQQASELIRKPQTFWNSGIFVATADKFLEYAHEWLPDNTRRLARLGKLLARYRTPVEAMATPSILMRVKRTYQALRSVSFDRGIMCHLRQGLVVQGDFPWA
ncbi:MAG: NTP transferase domain-containing protein, partial [Candidatus Omnitrophica bacterium]|nr:NTP transferase domain-containing protein [Candidatus Omnitrophota bacterium]